jgi:signal transduction histidine kinase
MVRGISDLIQGLALFFPLKVVIGIVGVGGVLALPFWFESVRDKQLRGLVRRMVRASEAERAQLVRRAFELAAGRPRRLGTLVRQAIHYDQRRLRDEALAALEATGQAPADVKHFKTLIAPAPIRFRDPIEAAVRIDQLLQQGLHVAAREQLQAAEQAFPGEPELEAFWAKLPAEDER